ncbi:MAG: tetratricopeptide repeat protein, partial [Cyanobacteriota bacterium]
MIEENTLPAGVTVNSALSSKNPPQKCKVCGADSHYFASAEILQKYNVKYYQCGNCGFVQTENPYWLAEAYSQAIATSDISLLYRNNMMANITSKLLFNYFDHTAKFLDYGGGYGVFTRLMRDQGFDFYWRDKYCQNLFATGFELQEKDQSELLLITAFELFEHLTDPLQELEALLKLAPNILFSTSLLPDANPKPDQWWYYAPQEGQHIAIYTRKSLEILAEKYHLKLYTDGEFIHLLTPETRLPDNLFELIKTGQVPSPSKPSFLANDASRVMSGLLTHSPTSQPSRPPGAVEKQAPIILIDGVFFQLYKTGIARVWKSLLEQWAKTEFGAHLLVLDRNNTAPKIDGLRYRTIRAYDYNDTERDRQVLQQICDEEQAELFISSYYTTPLSTPSTFMAYDMIPEVLGGDLNQPMWREKHRGINHASAFIAISHNTAKDLRQHFPQIPPAAITVAHCGVDPGFSPASPQEIANFKFKYGLQKPYFLVMLGGGHKNIILFLRGFAQLATRTGLDIVATGAVPQLPPDWRQLTAGCGFHGLQLTDEELKVAYSGAIALVYPSQYEGFGMPIIEAMACGCPVITCPNASIPEVAGEAAIYVGEQDADAMADALCEVQKPALRRRLIQAGLERAGRFSWPRMAQTVSQALLATAQSVKEKQPQLQDATSIIFAGGMAPQWRTWLYQACQFLLTQGEIPIEGKVCTSAADLDNYLSLMQPSQSTRLLGYRIWGDLSQKYLALPQNRQLFLYGDPFTLTAEELGQGKTPFSHILLELWLTQGHSAGLNPSQTCLVHFAQLLERPKPVLKEIAAFLGLTPTEKTLKDLLATHPLPAPDKGASGKGFGAKRPPAPDLLPPEQRLLLTLFLRPSRAIWFGADGQDYDRRLLQLFATAAPEVWQKTFQDVTDLLMDHLGDRLGDWLKTAYDHGVVPLRVENPQGAAQLLLTLGERLREREQEEQAKPFYQEALRLDPTNVQAALALGRLAEGEKNGAEATAYYQQALESDLDNAKALLRLATFHRVQKNFSQAEVYLEGILRQNPQDQLARYWLVKTLEETGELERAKQRFSEEEIELLQNLTGYLSGAGGKAFDEKNYEFAKDCYHLALEIDPHNYAHYFNLALIATKEKKPQAAIRYYHKSLTFKPDHPETLVNLAALLSQRGEFQPAIALLEQALKLDEQNSMAYHNLAICYVYQGRLAEAALYANQAVQNAPGDPLYHSHLLATLSAMKEVRSEDLAQVSRVWYDNHVVVKGLPRLSQYANNLDPDRPLRVGFVSGDFKRHSVSYFMKPIFQHHNPDQIQIYAYAQVEEPDDFTETLKGLCDHWRDTVELDDSALAAQIQRDQIDILVDLSGHTLLNRLAVFGMKPAPIQATYLGYPATTGLPTIDYWITDSYIHPPAATDPAGGGRWGLRRCEGWSGGG